ncbi:MAG: hypothetical protein MJZ75_02680 [Paludibacteraceae bacterium]|nr:hypothetical protein [Paludibacteraceae bacterium]
MKKLPILVALLGTMIFCASCAKHEEETKMISADDVRLSGQHKSLLSISSDSVKIMLVCTDEEDCKWDVRVRFSMESNQDWEDVPGREPKVAPKSDYSYFEPSMGNFEVTLLDANGNELDKEFSINYDAIKSILTSPEGTEEDILAQDRWSSLGDKSYNAQKAIYDKVANISISKLELDEIHVSAPSKSSNSSIYDDYEDALDDAVDAYEKALNAATSALDDIF